VEHIRTLTRELDTGDRVELDIEGRSGTIALRGDDTSRVRIEVVARLWADDELEADEQAELIARGIKHEGARVSVRAPTLLRPHPLLFFGRSPRIDYQISVPRRTSATIKNRSGRCEIEHIEGPLEIDARSGRVLLREVRGNVHIVSRSGSVQCEVLGGEIQVESRSGSVRLAGCAGALKVQSRSGSVQIEQPGADVRAQANSGSVRYDGDVLGSIEIEVESGSIKLSVNPDAVFFLDAESAHGSVRSDLPLRNSGGKPPSDSAPHVRLRARSGSIYIGPR
jgi:hypothetical protein